MDTQLAVKVLKNTALNVKHTEGIIIQSDLGSQYTSNLFESALAELKIRHSYSRKDAHTIMLASNHFTCPEEGSGKL